MEICAAVFAVNYAVPHVFGMDYPRILRAIMDAGDVTQADLAKRLGVEQPTVSRWLSGSEPKEAHRNRIVAEATRIGVIGDVRSEDVSAQIDPPRPRTVSVIGYVGATDEAHYYVVDSGALDHVAAPEGSTENTRAMEVRGSSLGPVFDRWLVFFDDVRSPVEHDLLGELCVVGLKDGRTLVKEIRRGNNGLHDLYSNGSAEPITDVTIEWAAKVKDMRPQ